MSFVVDGGVSICANTITPVLSGIWAMLCYLVVSWIFRMVRHIVVVVAVFVVPIAIDVTDTADRTDQNIIVQTIVLAVVTHDSRVIVQTADATVATATFIAAIVIIIVHRCCCCRRHRRREHHTGRVHCNVMLDWFGAIAGARWLERVCTFLPLDNHTAVLHWDANR